MSPSNASVEVLDPDPPYDRQLETRAKLLLNLYGAPEGSTFNPKRPRKDAKEPWFLVEHGWFSRLKSGDSWENWFKCHNPGRLNNGILMDPKNPSRLKERLIEFVDYDVVCEGIWLHIKQWYGIEGPEIIRYATSDGQLEVYPPSFRVGVTSESDEKWNDENIVELVFSKDSVTEEIVAGIRQKFDCGVFTLKHCSYGEHFSAVKIGEQRVQDLGWKTGDRLLVVFNAPKPVSSENFTSTTSSSSLTLYDRPHGNFMAITPNPTMATPTITINIGDKKGSKRKNGLCGLNNLGNTCYMNAVLQCLSHTGPLRAQLLSDKANKSVNLESKLGRKGEVVKETSELMRLMWSGEHSSVAPHGFKTALDRWTTMFRGFKQQDAHEALAFILDALHEDTNFSQPKERPSICESVFTGTSQSKLTCPECSEESTNSETFQILSLELPISNGAAFKDVNINSTPKISQFIKVVGIQGQLNILEITRSPSDTVKDIIAKVKSSLGTIGTDIVLAQVRKDFKETQNFRLLEILGGAAKVDSLPSQWEIVAFEVDAFPMDSESILVQSLHRRNNNAVVGVPFVFSILSTTTKRELLRKVEERFGSAGSTSYSLKTAVKSQKVTDVGHELVIDNTAAGIRLWSSAVLLLDWHKPAELHAYSLAALTIPEQVLDSSFAKAEFVTEPNFNQNQRDTLPDRIKAFCSVETLADDNLWLCPKCKEKRPASKQISLPVLPQVLVLHLKRFTAQGAKLSNSVVFTPLLQVNDENYELYAIIRHHGVSITGGHYDSLVRSSIDNTWYHCDDSRVSPVPTNRVGKFDLPGINWSDPSAYIFFYRRRQFASL